MFKTLTFVVLITCYMQAAKAMPSHASCQLQWEFPDSCSQVIADIVNQIDLWKGEDLCKAGTDQVNEKCLYSLVYADDKSIDARHETPEKHYVDDLFMRFASTNDGGCHADGFSQSETSYALYDQSTNYCNLHNLVDGAGLTQTDGFGETTSDDICTQYSTADCDRY